MEFPYSGAVILAFYLQGVYLAATLNTNAIITVADAGTFLELIPGQDTDRLKMLINSVSDFAERYTRRFFMPRVVTETYSGDGSNYLVLSRSPVSAITSVTLRNETAMSVADIILDSKAGALYHPNRLFTESFQNVTVGLTAGYGTVNAPEIPTDIKQAVRDTVAYYWKRDFIEYTAELKQALEGIPVSAFPNSAKAIFDSYRLPPI